MAAIFFGLRDWPPSFPISDAVRFFTGFACFILQSYAQSV